MGYTDIDPTNIDTAFHDFADGDGTYSVELSLKIVKFSYKL